MYIEKICITTQFGNSDIINVNLTSCRDAAETVRKDYTGAWRTQRGQSAEHCWGWFPDPVPGSAVLVVLGSRLGSSN